MDTHADRRRQRTLRILLATASATAVAWSACAAAQQRPGPGDGWHAVDAARLASLRGGYVMPSGLLLAFGIERAVMVNGELVASASVAIPDVAAMTPAQAAALADMRRTLVVQVGPGNTYTGAGAGGVVVQNTLDGQRISAMTTLQVEVGTLGLLQDLNTQAAMQAALAGAIGGP